MTRERRKYRFKIGSRTIRRGETVTDYLGARFTFRAIYPPKGSSLFHKVLVTRPCPGEPDECHVLSPFLFGGWIEQLTRWPRR